MFLSKITVTDFKNIAHSDLDFSHKINCISGNNGEGKTNLLDAVYYLCMTKSYFHFPDSFSISHGCAATALLGCYTMEDGTINRISIGLYDQKEGAENKVVKRNGKIYKRLADHIGLFPIVMVSPSDTVLINQPAQERRRFINALLSQVDKEYLHQVLRYNKILAQRNKLLKDMEPNEELLSALDSGLSETASYIFDARQRLCNSLNQTISEYYRQLSGGSENVRITYSSDLYKGKLAQLLQNSRERDKMLKHTTCGVHRDDILFEIGNEEFYPVRRCASQGQQKCFLIALKLAQFSIMKSLNGDVAPILLLDDIFDKLDMGRVEYLLQLVSGNSFGQIFITDSNKVRMKNLIDKIGGECKVFEVEKGVIREVQ